MMLHVAPHVVDISSHSLLMLRCQEVFLEMSLRVFCQCGAVYDSNF